MEGTGTAAAAATTTTTTNSSASDATGGGTADQLSSLPSSIICFGICPFLTLEDILSLRPTCTRIFRTLHNDRTHGSEGEEQTQRQEEEVEHDDLWKFVLKRDFGLECDDSDDGVLWTVRLHKTDITDVLQPARSRFEAVKAWKKASSHVYRGWDLEKSIAGARQAVAIGVANRASVAMSRGHHPHVYAPYFLRAARFWKSFVQWCRFGPSVSSKDGNSDEVVDRSVRIGIRETLFGGFTYELWDEKYRHYRGMLATQALSAICGIQTKSRDQSNGLWLGMFGGYQAYDYVTCTAWTEQMDGPLDNVCFAADNFPDHFAEKKRLLVNAVSGQLLMKAGFGNEILHLVNVEGRDSGRFDDILVWAEEYCRRLSQGEIGVGIMGSHPHSPRGITLFPRYVPGSTPPMVDGVPVVSRKVTRGVEVIASAVYVPQVEHHFGFIYSIRIRLLTPDDGDEYVTPEQRGFEKCALLQRHWRITNAETGLTEAVDGNGVIGMFPVLKEGGYWSNIRNEDLPGTFQYQSCTGPMKKGSFAGHLSFQPLSINGDMGNEDSVFRVEVGSFALDSQPPFLF